MNIFIKKIKENRAINRFKGVLTILGGNYGL